MEIVHEQVESYRRQLERVLASGEFAGSRQQRDFLVYVADAAFQHRPRLDQVEIAREVLHRGEDFDPVYDPAVRKLATLTRQRLESYYAKEGLNDPIVISLPARTYIPQFHSRTRADQVQEVVAPPVIPSDLPAGNPRQPIRSRWLLWATAGLAVAGAVVAGLTLSLRSRSIPAGEFLLNSVRGDVMHESNDLSPTALQLGPQVGPVGQVTVRMRFAPDRATQQAGLMIYENPDRYVKLGRQFLSRSELEFGMETGARYRKPPNTFTYDPRGQSGEPIWLSIRRIREAFTAYISYDGHDWRPFGNVLNMPDPMPNARVAIFALNGRSDAPPAQATFDRLTTGLDFFDWPADVTLDNVPGWRVISPPCSQPLFDEHPGVLLPFNAGPQDCSTDFLRSVPSGDWAVSTYVEFSGSGTAAGLTCRGSKGRFRLILWDVNGGSISAEHLGHTQVNRTSYPGDPPTYLQMQCRNGVLQGSFSRDGLNFEAIDLKVPLEQLGKDIQIGLHTAKGTWGSRMMVPPAPRFSYFHQNVTRLTNYR